MAVSGSRTTAGSRGGMRGISPSASGTAFRVDMRTPFWVYGGLQDNGTWAGPSATYSTRGVLHDDWLKWGGGDGFLAIPDTTDHRTLYVESQYLGLSRVDMVTGERSDIRPGDPTGAIGARRNWRTWPDLDDPGGAARERDGARELGRPLYGVAARREHGVRGHAEVLAFARSGPDVGRPRGLDDRHRSADAADHESGAHRHDAVARRRNPLLADALGARGITGRAWLPGHRDGRRSGARLS